MSHTKGHNSTFMQAYAYYTKISKVLKAEIGWRANQRMMANPFEHNFKS